MTHPINDRFAKAIANRYVQMYQVVGFKEAQEYLDFMCKGNVKLREHLIPIIVEEGNARK